MKYNRWISKFITTLSVLVLLASGLSFIPAVVSAKTQPNRLQPLADVVKNKINIKFKAGSNVTLQNGTFTASDSQSVNQLNAILNSAKKVKADRLVDKDAGGKDNPLAQSLSNYYTVRFSKDVDIDSVISQLKSLPIVDQAYAQSKPAPAPSSSTPNFTSLENYRNAAPNGVNANFAASYPGSSGSKTKIVDLEYSWNQNHEDLTKAPTALIKNGTPLDPFGDNNHGTAVLGEMVADNNSFGVTGVSSGANLRLINVYNNERAWDIPTALAIAAYITKPGDTVLIEQQTYDPNGNFVAVEWEPAIYDAIVYLTSHGRTVIEPAANGGQNYDDTSLYGTKFPQGKADSGAIMVGAGENCGSTNHRTRLNFSNYGSRVNLQGPGDCVVSTGWYGDLYNVGGVNTYYTNSFGGTSSASPVVAAAAVDLNSAYLALNGQAATPSWIRLTLIANSTAQPTTDTSGHIGPEPDLAKALLKADRTAPSNATNVSVSLNSSNQPVLNWTAATDNVKVSSYLILRNHKMYNLVIAPGTTFTDTNVVTKTSYIYYIITIDSAGNISVASTTVGTTTN